VSDLRALLLLAAEHLRQPATTIESEFSASGAESRQRSWCSWTTFDRLEIDAGYWTAELPLMEELGETYVKDGGTWGQPFSYDAIAHIIIPRRFIEEPFGQDVFRQWSHEQDIQGLAARLDSAGVRYHISEYALELKLF
jgi:hypothetical protein